MKANERFHVGQRVRFGYAEVGYVIGTIREITFGGAKAGVEPTAMVEADEDGTTFITPQSMIKVVSDLAGDDIIPARPPVYYAHGGTVSHVTGGAVSPGTPELRRNSPVPPNK
ncbi:MAG: hypothetical protein WD046_13765 [Paracoccaceae bacterium]